MRKAFDLNQAMEDAWNWLWADNLKRRKSGNDWKGDSYYLTATDLERQVRSFAEEDFEGKPRGSTGRGSYSYGTTVRISTGGRGNLLNIVRDWLHAQYTKGRFERHNFGRGHISGMRYRPTGEPIGERAIKTMKAKEKRANTPRPIHYATNYGATPLCVQRKGRFMWSRSRARTAKNWKEVNCKRCLNKKAEAKE